MAVDIKVQLLALSYMLIIKVRKFDYLAKILFQLSQKNRGGEVAPRINRVKTFFTKYLHNNWASNEVRSF